MTTLPPTEATAYIWIADQTEPGHDGHRLEATNTRTPPAPIKPVKAIDGLVHDVSLYGDWRLLGTVRATALRDAYDEPTLKLWAPLMYGVQLGVQEVVTNGWYQKA